jgi:hypothetical protein
MGVGSGIRDPEKNLSRIHNTGGKIVRVKFFGGVHFWLVSVTKVTTLKHEFASFYNLLCTVSSNGWIWKRNDNSRSCLDPREIVHSINSYSFDK